MGLPPAFDPLRRQLAPSGTSKHNQEEEQLPLCQQSTTQQPPNLLTGVRNICTKVPSPYDEGTPDTRKTEADRRPLSRQVLTAIG